MMKVPCYPDFEPMSLDLKSEMHPRLSLTADGVSEFTFAGLYLFRNRYSYRVSRESENGGFIISGEHEQKKFFMTPCGAPENAVLENLFNTHDYWKNISETVFESSRPRIEALGVSVGEDRDNFDYLYYRSDLAELPGKKYHKKKNLVNQFLSNYAYEQRPLTAALVPCAMEVLERWREGKSGDSDYAAAREALELFDALPLRGYIFFIDGKPAAYCTGESTAKGKMFTVHFEKAVEQYKGIYQFINKSFAAALPQFFTFINREQDMGNEGLRQAKMTYRPYGFVKKHKGHRE